MLTNPLHLAPALPPLAVIPSVWAAEAPGDLLRGDALREALSVLGRFQPDWSVVLDRVFFDPPSTHAPLCFGPVPPLTHSYRATWRLLVPCTDQLGSNDGFLPQLSGWLTFTVTLGQARPLASLRVPPSAPGLQVGGGALEPVLFPWWHSVYPPQTGDVFTYHVTDGGTTWESTGVISSDVRWVMPLRLDAAVPGRGHAPPRQPIAAAAAVHIVEAMVEWLPSNATAVLPPGVTLLVESDVAPTVALRAAAVWTGTVVQPPDDREGALLRLEGFEVVPYADEPDLAAELVLNLSVSAGRPDSLPTGSPVAGPMPLGVAADRHLTVVPPDAPPYRVSRLVTYQIPVPRHPR
jgi:hypothetical protein